MTVCPDAASSAAAKRPPAIVALTLEAQGDKTLVTLRHSGVPDDDFGRTT